MLSQTPALGALADLEKIELLYFFTFFYRHIGIYHTHIIHIPKDIIEKNRFFQKTLFLLEHLGHLGEIIQEQINLKKEHFLL